MTSGTNKYSKEEKIKMIYDRHCRLSQEFNRSKDVATFVTGEHILTEKLQKEGISPAEYFAFVNAQK